MLMVSAHDRTQNLCLATLMRTSLSGRFQAPPELIAPVRSIIRVFSDYRPRARALDLFEPNWDGRLRRASPERALAQQKRSAAPAVLPPVGEESPTNQRQDRAG
jgi:hypothetical protein